MLSTKNLENLQHIYRMLLVFWGHDCVSPCIRVHTALVGHAMRGLVQVLTVWIYFNRPLMGLVCQHLLAAHHSVYQHLLELARSYLLTLASSPLCNQHSPLTLHTNMFAKHLPLNECLPKWGFPLNPIYWHSNLGVFVLATFRTHYISLKLKLCRN